MKVKLRFKKSHTYILPVPEVTVVIEGEMSKVDEILSVVREKAREWKEWEET